MRSMTGFGAASRDRERLAVRAEVRSVNHRYLQVKVRLPGELAWLESDVEERVRAVLERGSVSVYVALSAGTALTTAAINSKAARRYKILFGELSRDLGIPGELELSTLAALPGVLSAEVDTLAQARARRAVLEVVDDALVALGGMREREGQATAKELEGNARRIRKLVQGIKRRMPEVVRRHQTSLHARVEVLLAGRGGVRPEDLAREIALLADRMDVSEELGRLQSHLDQLAQIMAREGAVGRALEFLAQEFLREANTIGSKCNDAAVAHDVVELKTLIERLREQVMNVE
jgi:uncharacterized protein (TIGR00255 family)